MAAQSPPGTQFMQAFCQGEYHRCLELYPQMLQTQPELLIMLGPAQVFLVSCQRLGLHEVAESFGAQMITNRVESNSALSAVRDEVADFMQGLMRWEADLVRLTLGQAELTDVAGRASTDVQRFQARYYAAARMITLGRTIEAQEELGACLRERPTSDCLEVQLASYEYKRLLGGDPGELSENFRRLFTGGDLAGAIRTGRQLVEVSRATYGERSGELCMAVDNLAHACYLAGDLTEAKSLWSESAEVIRANLGDQHPLYAERLGKLARIHERLGNPAEARRMHEQAEAIFDRHGMGESFPEHAEHLCRCLHELAKFHDDAGDYLRAERLYRRALEVRRQVHGPDHADTATSLMRLADLHRVLGLRETAGPLLLEAAEVTRRIASEESEQYADRMNSIALFHVDAGNAIQAEALFRQALEIRRRLHGDEHPAVAQALANLGQFYRQIGDWGAALGATKRAVEVFRRLGDHGLQLANALNNLAGLHSLVRDLDAAEPLYREALEMQRRALGERHEKVAEVESNLAVVLLMRGDAAAAEPLLRQATTTVRECFGERHERYGNCLHNLAQLHLVRGDLAAAEQALRAAVAVKAAALSSDHSKLIDTLSNLVFVLAASGRPAEALETLARISVIEDRHLGQVFRVGSSRQQLEHLRLPLLHLDLVLALVRQHFPDQPQWIVFAWDLVLRRKALAAEASFTQRDAMVGGKYPQLREKFAKLAAVRWEVARRAMVDSDAAEPDGHREDLAAWEARCESLEAELARAVPELQLDQRLRAVGRRDVAAALPADSALVEFVRFRDPDLSSSLLLKGPASPPDRYAAFIVRPEKPDEAQFVDLGEAGAVERLIADFRSRVTGDAEGRNMAVSPAVKAPIRVQGAGTALRAAVFDRIRAALGTARRVFLVPDGDLYLLPFEVLPDEAGQFLIDRYRFSYLDTGRDLLRFGQTASGRNNEPVVIADPDFDLGQPASPPTHPGLLARGFSREALTSPGLVSAKAARGAIIEALTRAGTSFPRLAGTRSEGERVGGLLGVVPWLGGEALERRLKGHRSPLVLHLATHGYFLNESDDAAPESIGLSRGEQAVAGRLTGRRLANPLLRSGLALAGANVWLRGGTPPDEAEDGLLTAEDVAGLDLLDTELVVLSACNTGLGDIRRYEGVFGLRRAFLLAGANTVVMSLWKVPDLATAILMEQFYHNLLNRGSERDLALSEAQRYLRDLSVGQIRAAWLSPLMGAKVSGDPAAREELQRLAPLPDDHRPFADPACWGAFICQGDPARLGMVGLRGFINDDPARDWQKAERGMPAPATPSADEAQTVARIARFNSQAMQLAQQGRVEQGLELARQALELARGQLGTRHRETGATLNTLAGLYQDMSRFAEAEPLLREALEVSHLTLGKDHPTYAVALGNLAGILQRLGRRREAIPMLRESLDLLQRTVGRDDQSYARTALFLAQIHASLGEESAAESLIEPALAVLRADLGPAHPRYLHSLKALAAAFRQGQMLATAERWLRAAADLLRQNLGEGHPDVIDGLLAISALQQERGDVQAADATLEQAFETLPVTVSGVGAVQRLHVLSELTGLAVSRQDRDLAEQRYRSLQIALGNANRLDSPYQPVLLGRSATLALALGKPEDARQAAQQAAELQLRFLAEGYPQPAAALAETGLACSRTGLLDLARSLLSRALPLLHQSLGDDHELCIACHEVLAATNDRLRGAESDEAAE